MYTYRSVVETDYPALARIRNSYRPEPVLAELVKAMTEQVRSLCDQRLHLVAVTAAGEPVGEVMALHDPEWQPGEWVATLGVLPEHRGSGIGTELYQRAEEFARAEGAKLIRFRVEGGQEAGHRFAMRLGYTLERERREMVLTLADWDGARFGKQVASLRASGIRLMSLPSLANEGLLYQMYDLEMETLEEASFYAGLQKPFEVWAREHTGLQPGEQFCTVALDGDRLVGVSTIYLPHAPGMGARQGYTAVRRAYRGRGIALALKLVNIKECKARGASHIRTNTDPENAAVQAMNTKLGFREVPGPRMLVKQIG